ncbi:MAG TPA: bifunctional phosphoribosylaminoimidazolecarboxamide formyltransferase/IMP cyclohydrolase [Candidatus Krumholzibacteria bacterium]|nr:bifunctional phosphoribosylaminoimidazolecarboxamide formyltransferase/IMP cyclohydrolase [Candidatus Krumholzibacteria bacterium]
MKKTLKASTALISVTDKTGLAELGAALNDRGIRLIASSGTKTFLEAKGVPVEEISAYTSSPEILGGRVKTLHPRIHGGILADRDNADHVRTLEEDGTYPIDYVVVNLYPFEEQFRAGLAPDELIEYIDIGGITLLRAAAKNHRHVTVLTHPAQYDAVIAEIRTNGATSREMRARLAADAFALTATYDAAIAHFMRGVTGGEGLPERLPIGLTKVTDVRYGENPHQRGALYRTVADSPFTTMKQLQGKELSFNNYLDMIGAFTLVRDLGPGSVAIIKHNNPCGAAWCGDVLKSWRRALHTDRVSAFGGVVAVHGTVGAELAEELGQLFLEVVMARAVEPAAAALLEKKKNLRVVTIPDAHWGAPAGGSLAVWTHDVALVEDEDAGFPELGRMETVTTRKPTDAETVALTMAWKVAKNVKSNAIVIADGEGTVGIGAGQMSRVDSSHVAARKAADAGLAVQGAAAASDAFFPFADGVKELARAGIAAVIQPGGSIRDQEVIDAANDAGLAMVFTGRRHFRHV